MSEFKTNVGRAGCHIANLGELLTSLDIQFGDENSHQIKIPLEKAPALVGLFWAKLQESFLECEGKELLLDFGNSAGANFAEQLLKMLLNFLPKEQA